MEGVGKSTDVFRYIELIIEPRAPLTYTVRARDSKGGIISENFRLDIESHEIKPLLRSLDECLQPESLRTHRLALQTQKKLGSFLFNKVVSGKIRDMYLRNRGIAGSPLRIRLNVEAKTLEGLPWELMYDYERDSWLTRDSEIAFCRFTSLPEGSRRPKFQLPINVLLALANPLGLGDQELDLNRERDKVSSALKALTDSRGVDLRVLDESVTLQNMYRQVANNANVLHFSGHGGSADDGLVILLENEDGRRQEVPFERFVSLLAGVNNLFAVILDACELAAGAPALLKKKAPIVVAMRSAILDETATLFFEEFYKALVSLTPIDEAITNSRKNLVAKFGEELVDWFTPILYLASPDAAFIETVKKPSLTASTPERKRYDKLIALRNIGRFVGRRPAIRWLRDRVYDRDSRVIVVEGLSGDGKTTLVSKVILDEKEDSQGVYSHFVTADTSLELLLSEFNEFLEKNGDYTLSEIWGRPDLSIEAKTDSMVEVLVHNQYLLFLDGFQNLVSGGKIVDRNIDRFLERVLTRKMSSKVLITTWKRFELAQGQFLGSLQIIHLPPLERDEGMRLLNNLGLRNVEVGVKNDILKVTGRSPKFIELFVGMTRKFSIKDLLSDRSLFAREAYGKLVEKIVNILDNGERLALQTCALFRKPVSMSMLKCVDLQPQMISRLSDLLVLEVDQSGGNYLVHDSLSSILREHLKEASKDDYIRLQNRVGECWEKMVEQTKNLWDHLAARHHFIEAGNSNRATDIANSTTRSLINWGYIRLAMELNKESLKTATGDRKAVALHHIGMIHQDKGEYDKALENYNKGLEISEKLGDQSGISKALHQIGIIHQLQGEYDKALENYNKSLEIKKRLGDQSGISASLHNIGIIHQDKGEYDKALENYNKGLEIKKRLGDQSGIASTLCQIGRFYAEKEQFKEAIKFSIKGFAIFARLNSLYKELAKKDLDKIRAKMGKQSFDKLIGEVKEESEDFQGLEK